MMKQQRLSVSAWILLMLASIPYANAAVIGLELVPSAATVTPGDTVTVDVIVSGLGAGAPPSVGAYDLNVLYDPLLFATPTVSFGSLLGNIPAEAIAITDFPVANIVNFAEVSLLPSDALDLLQPDSFSLATLSFSAIGTGAGEFTFAGDRRVDDAFGAKLTIPEPQPLALIAVGLIALIETRRRIH